MASGQVNIRPESLLAASRQFQHSTDDLARALETLQAKELGAGSPWGHDEMGTVFAEAYTECTSMGLQAMAHLVDQLGSIADGLQQMGQNVQSTDQAHQTTFDRGASNL